MITLRSYVEDQFVAGKDALRPLHNPATEEVIAQTSTTGIDMRRVVDHARRVGRPALAAMTFAERGEMLKKMSKVLHEVRDALIDASIENGGTTRSDSKFDIDGATGTLAYYANVGTKLGAAKWILEGEGEALTRGPRFWGNHLKTTRPGVAVHVNAFNFPAWGLAEKAAVALLAGVPVISKPATPTALVAYRIMERLVETKVLPEGALQFLCGDPGDLLSHLGPCDMIAFTGSGKTGAVLRGLEAVVHRSTRINVEADSLNAAVVAPDVELGSETFQMFIRDHVKEITQKTGQKCTATRRIFAPAPLIDAIQEELAERLGTIRVGDPQLEEVRMGPLANAAQLKDVRAGVAKLTASGARIVRGRLEQTDITGGVPGKGYFVEPILLRAEARSATAVHEHEVFGPVSTLMPYDEVTEIGELVALGQGSLVTSLYTDDRENLSSMLSGIAPWTGRVLVGSSKVADQAIAPGMVLPSCVHGGPGRAGGGEELGGERGLDFYMQRTAIQGDRALLDKVLR